MRGLVLVHMTVTQQIEEKRRLHGGLKCSLIHRILVCFWEVLFLNAIGDLLDETERVRPEYACFVVEKAEERWTCGNEGWRVDEWQPNLTHVVFKCGSFVPCRRRGHEKAGGILSFCLAADCKGQFQEYLKGMLVSFIYILSFTAFTLQPCT